MLSALLHYVHERFAEVDEAIAESLALKIVLAIYVGAFLFAFARGYWLMVQLIGGVFIIITFLILVVDGLLDYWDKMREKK